MMYGSTLTSMFIVALFTFMNTPLWICSSRSTFMMCLMVSAVQPHLHGLISERIQLPTTTSLLWDIL